MPLQEMDIGEMTWIIHKVLGMCTWACHHMYDTPHYRRSHAYLICLITDSFDVCFSPSSWYPINYLSIVHVIASNFSTSTLIWLLPSKNHWVTKTFKTSDIIGWRWCRCCNIKSSWVDRNASIMLHIFHLFHWCMREGHRSCSIKRKHDTDQYTWHLIWCMRK